LDCSAREQYAREAWKILYNQEQREILENAEKILLSQKIQKKNNEKLSQLYEEVYMDSNKVFSRIKKLTEELDMK